ncbi:MAG: hypothetical protein ACQESP_00555 [Candidatus Muiribacteriota bacterium]
MKKFFFSIFFILCVLSSFSQESGVFFVSLEKIAEDENNYELRTDWGAKRVFPLEFENNQFEKKIYLATDYDYEIKLFKNDRIWHVFNFQTYKDKTVKLNLNVSFINLNIKIENIYDYVDKLNIIDDNSKLLGSEKVEKNSLLKSLTINPFKTKKIKITDNKRYYKGYINVNSLKKHNSQLNLDFKNFSRISPFKGEVNIFIPSEKETTLLIYNLESSNVLYGRKVTGPKSYSFNIKKTGFYVCRIFSDNEEEIYNFEITENDYPLKKLRTEKITFVPENTYKKGIYWKFKNMFSKIKLKSDSIKAPIFTMEKPEISFFQNNELIHKQVLLELHEDNTLIKEGHAEVFAEVTWDKNQVFLKKNYFINGEFHYIPEFFQMKKKQDKFFLSFFVPLSDKEKTPDFIRVKFISEDGKESKFFEIPVFEAQQIQLKLNFDKKRKNMVNYNLAFNNLPVEFFEEFFIVHNFNKEEKNFESFQKNKLIFDEGKYFYEDTATAKEGFFQIWGLNSQKKIYKKIMQENIDLNKNIEFEFNYRGNGEENKKNLLSLLLILVFISLLVFIKLSFLEKSLKNILSWINKILIKIKLLKILSSKTTLIECNEDFEFFYSELFQTEILDEISFKEKKFLKFFNTVIPVKINILDEEKIKFFDKISKQNNINFHLFISEFKTENDYVSIESINKDNLFIVKKKKDKLCFGKKDGKYFICP